MKNRINTGTAVLILGIIIGIISCSKDSIGPGGEGSTGVGGSLARFTISGNYLYTVTNNALQTYELNNTDYLIQRNEIDLDEGVETIFPYEDNLLLGTQDGMLIYNIADPEQPQYRSTYRHILSCDPVVASNNIAYVTLRAGTDCRTGNNQLDIIDIFDVTNPVLLKSYDMSNPYGLGIDSLTLFVCDGYNGIKVFNVADPYNIQKLHQTDNGRFYDVIPINDVLIATGQSGLYQYDYSNRDTLILLSKLKSN